MKQVASIKPDESRSVFFGSREEGGGRQLPALAESRIGAHGGVRAYDVSSTPTGVRAMATSSEPWRLDLLDVQLSSGAENTIFARMVQGTAVLFCAMAMSVGAGQTPTSAPILASRGTEILVPALRRRREEGESVDGFSVATDTPPATGSSGVETEAVTAGEQASVVQAWLGITRTMVAELLRVSRPTLHSWLNGDVVTPRSEVNTARLRLLHDLAVAWHARGGRALGDWMNVKVPGGTLRQLLTTSEWDRSRIDRALEEIARHQERQEAQRMQEHAARARIPSGNELDESARNRQTLRRIRRFQA